MIFLVASFLVAFPSKSYMDSSSPPFVLYALAISSSFIPAVGYMYRK
jgi:mannose/fructose/N-acetylgalactosamine-specific phosphotransferase system component IIC